jgi:hypothetical protein
VVDGVAHLLADTFVAAKESIPATDIGKDRPVVFGINSLVTMSVNGAQLAAGEHTVIIGVQTKEAGELKWDVTDTVA